VSQIGVSKIEVQIRAGSLLILYYVCKQQSAVYFLLKTSQEGAAVQFSTFQAVIVSLDVLAGRANYYILLCSM
jgi:hypothetical protein